MYFVCKDCNETCLDNSGSIPINKAQEDAQTCTSFVKIVMKHVETNSGSIPMNKAQEDAQMCTSFVKIVMKHVQTIVVQSL